MANIVKAAKNKMELPAAIDMTRVLSERALEIIGKKEEREKQLSNSAMAIQRKVERLKKRISEMPEVQELKELMVKLRNTNATISDINRSISVTIEDDLINVPGDTLYDKIQYLAKATEAA